MPDKGLMPSADSENAACVSRIVYSVAGRDKKRAFVVVGICDKERALVYIADGRLHTLAKPKVKNLKHLRFTADSVELERADDERLREYLKSY